MDERTLTALKASIKHWEENVQAKTPDKIKLGVSHCALCAEFWTRDEARLVTCDGCPVWTRTGKHGCSGSPYEAAEEAHDDWDDVFDTVYESDEGDEWRKAAQAELDFLNSLLPEQVGA